MKFLTLSLGLLSAVMAVTACGDDDTSSNSTSSTSSTTSGMGGASSGTAGGGGLAAGSGGSGGTAVGGSGGMAAFALSVDGHNEGAMWKNTYECPNCNNGGQQLSPPLSWTPGPASTQSYAIVMRDLDFMNGFVHWAIWDIPASSSMLAEGIPEGYTPGAPAPAGTKQAAFNAQLEGYLGMCSCNSINTYEFTVHAMPDATLAGVDNNTSKEAAAAAIEAASLASAALSGES